MNEWQDKNEQCMRQAVKGSNSGLIWDIIPGGNEENQEKSAGSWCDDRI